MGKEVRVIDVKSGCIYDSVIIDIYDDIVTLLMQSSLDQLQLDGEVKVNLNDIYYDGDGKCSVMI